MKRGDVDVHLHTGDEKQIVGIAEGDKPIHIPIEGEMTRN